MVAEKRDGNAEERYSWILNESYVIDKINLKVIFKDGVEYGIDELRKIHSNQQKSLIRQIHIQKKETKRSIHCLPSMKFYYEKKYLTDPKEKIVKFWQKIFEGSYELSEAQIVEKVYAVTMWEPTSSTTTKILNLLYKYQNLGYIWYAGNIPNHKYQLNPAISCGN